MCVCFVDVFVILCVYSCRSRCTCVDEGEGGGVCGGHAFSNRVRVGLNSAIKLILDHDALERWSLWPFLDVAISGLSGILLSISY